jgi:2-phospho-L-lactate guanylyltransferase
VSEANPTNSPARGASPSGPDRSAATGESERLNLREVGWVVVLPIKSLRAAKSRLRGAVPGVAHDQLVLAMAEDTVAAAMKCPQVSGAVVISDDSVVRATLAELGATCVPDEPGSGINAALAYGAGLAGGAPVAALTADLPALRPEDLGAALQAATRAGGRAYVPDAAGTGTVLLTAVAGATLAPCFGSGSAAAHSRSGAVRLLGDWQRLRRDVDTFTDLGAAAALGLGVRTTALVGAALR